MQDKPAIDESPLMIGAGRLRTKVSALDFKAIMTELSSYGNGRCRSCWIVCPEVAGDRDEMGLQTTLKGG